MQSTEHEYTGSDRERPRVVCVYKSGGDFTVEYVRRLSISLEAYSGLKLTCLSDDPAVAEYAEYVPIQHTDWPKWWPKLELFEHFNHALYVDLDVIIKRDVRLLLDMEPYSFGILAAFGKSGKGNSSVMRWHGDYSYIPAAFSVDRIPEYSQKGRLGKWGDQDFIYDHLGFKPDFIQHKFPNMVASRKRDPINVCRNAALLCYHGKPRPHDTNWWPL